MNAWAPTASRFRTAERFASTAPFVISLFSIAAIYIGFAAFTYTDYVNLGVPRRDRVDPMFFGVMYSVEISIAILIGAAALIDETFRQRLRSPPALVCYAVLILYGLIGLVMGNKPGDIRHDWVLFACVLAGVAMQRLFMRTTVPAMHLIGIGIFAAGMLYISTKASADLLSNEAVNSEERLYDVNIFRYCNFLLPTIGLVCALVAFKNPFYFAGFALLVGVYFYCGVIVGATRSLALDLIVVLVLAACGLPFARDRGLILTKFRPAGIALIAVFVLILIGAVIALSGVFSGGSSTIADRFTSNSGQDYDSITDRFEEIDDAVQQVGFWKLFVGPGVGTTFESIFDYESYGLHIGIFSFLLKFGAFPFLLIILGLYVYLPAKFAQALLRPRTLDPHVRTAILVTLPAAFSWISILAMSGGYQSEWFLPLGIAIGFFADVKEHGLDCV